MHRKRIDRHPRRRVPGGFSLVEVMIAVAVVGLLAAVALPSYQEYVVRSKVTEALSLASGAKVAVTTAYQDTRGLPKDNAAAHLPAAETIQGNYVGSVAVENGDIRVTFNDAVSQLAGRSLILQASADGGTINWCCYSPNIAGRFLPANCRDGGACGGEADEDREAKEREAQEREAQEREAQEREAQEREAQEQEAREQEAREQEAREQEAREQEAREREAKEQEERDKETDGCPKGFKAADRGASGICHPIDSGWDGKCPDQWKPVGGGCKK